VPTDTAGAGEPSQLLVDVTRALGLPDAEPWPDGTYWMPEIFGSGVGLLDYDRDGDLDILQIRAARPGERVRATPERLFRQEADGSFRDVTQAAGLRSPGFGQGLAVGDADGDGDADVYVTRQGADVFYRNAGDGTFRDATAEAGIAGERWSTAATFCDYDRDGHLDLFVVHYLRVDYEGPCRDGAGAPEYCGPQTFDGVPDVLYRNQGDGTFRDVTHDAGLRLPRPAEAKGLGALCVDLTGDDWPDIYVANDGEANQLWVNRGDGTFADEAVIRGVAFNRHGRPEASMGVTAGDVNGDGRLDLFMTHLTLETHTLYASAGERLFLDRTIEARLASPDVRFTGFGCGFIDLDHDGDLDLAVVHGEVRRTASAAADSFWGRYAQPNLLLENDGAGRFASAADRTTDFTAPRHTSRGLAFGDLDSDGDLDLVLSEVDGTLRVLRNDAPAAGHHAVMVRALSAGRDALGARVRVTDAVGTARLGLAIAGYSYLASSDPRAHVGLGEVPAIESIDVVWPGGSRERFRASAADREYVVLQGQGVPW
jgi:hypothetical protein